MRLRSTADVWLYMHQSMLLRRALLIAAPIPAQHVQPADGAGGPGRRLPAL